VQAPYVTLSEARGPSALACLRMTKREACFGMTKRKACLGMTRWEAATPRGFSPGDAVPNEVRGASLSLGKTIKRTLGRSEEGEFFGTTSRNLD